MLAELECTPTATPDELLGLIEHRNLYGRGWSLLAAALLGGRTVVWTLDKRLASIAFALKLAYRPVLHS